jgi:hypothetical protein
MEEVRIGSVFAGHRIDAVAGRGGMGIVYRATQITLDRTVALKVVTPGLIDDPTVRQRFIREARSAASLDHPNVIPIHHAGEEGGVGYIVMRYVDGDDLRTLIRRTGPIGPVRAAQLVAQIGAALDAAHAAGLVHRDVKPANALVGVRDHVYLTDFGLTKCLQEASASTHTSGWVGTLDYVAPEQIRGERVDARTDVYALGCVLYFLLTGKPPFGGEGHEHKLWAHLTAEPPKVPAAPAFDPVIARAMAKRPADRYQSAGDLGRAALAAAVGRHHAEPDRSVATGDAAAAPTELLDDGETRDASPPVTVPLRPRRRRWAWAAVAAAAVLVAGVAVALELSGTGGQPSGVLAAHGTSTPTPTATPAPISRPRVEQRALPVKHPATVLTAAAGHLWLVSPDVATPREVDVDKVRMVDTNLPPVPGTTDAAGVSDTLWLVRASDRTATPLSARTGAPVGPVAHLEGTPVAIAPDLGSAWIGLGGPSGASDEVVQVRRSLGVVVQRLPVRGGVQRVEIYAGSIWVATRRGLLLRFDPNTRALLSTFRLPPGRIGDLIAGGGYLWTSLTERNRVVRVDPTNGSSTEVRIGRRPEGLAFTGGVVYAALRAASRVARIDSDTLKPAGPAIPVPAGPAAMATMFGDIWVSCIGGHRLVRLRVP